MDMLNDEGLIGADGNGLRTTLPLVMNGDAGVRSSAVVGGTGASAHDDMGLLPPAVSEGMLPVSVGISVDGSDSTMPAIGAMVDPFAPNTNADTDPQGHGHVQERDPNGGAEEEEVDAFQGALDEFYYDANSVAVDPFHWFANGGGRDWGNMGDMGVGAGGGLSQGGVEGVGVGGQGQGQGSWGI